MKSPTLLVFDIGLTHAKALLFEPNGQIIARGISAYPTIRHAPNLVEQRMEDWLGAMQKSAREVRIQNPEAYAAISGITLTAHMHSLVCLDAYGQANGPALVLGDSRAKTESEALKKELGEDFIYETTGASMDPNMPAAKIAWLRKNDATRWQNTKHFTGCRGALIAWLSGKILEEPIDACATSLYDLRRRCWSEEMVSAVGININQLPAIVPSQSIAGYLGEDAATTLNLKDGIPIITGAGDDIEVIGCGATEPGTFVEHLGSTGSILAVSNELPSDPRMVLECYPHILDDLWVIGGSITAAGTAIGWGMKTLGVNDINEALSMLETKYGDNETIFLPNLQGERAPDYVSQSRGAWLGMNTSSTQQDLMRAVFQGVVFSLKRVLNHIESLSMPASSVAVSQGGDLNENWVQLRSDIYDRPLVIPESIEPTSLGAAIVLATGLNMYPDIDNAINHMTQNERTFVPINDDRYSFHSAFLKFERFREALAPVWE